MKETIHKPDILSDIDSDFFVFNGLGSFVNDTCRYLLSPDGAKCLEIIRLLCQKACDVDISISEFGKYLPLELKLIINYIYSSLTDGSFVLEFDKITRCFNNLLEYETYGYNHFWYKVGNCINQKRNECESLFIRLGWIGLIIIREEELICR